jgi:trehalose-phosphatase
VNRPDEVAAAVATAERPVLLGIDVDGTLSPIAAKATDARLAAGAAAALDQLAGRDGIVLAVVSGRPLHDLRDQFGFDGATRLVGSHGLEDTAGPPLALDEAERRHLAEVARELREVASAVEGAWVEDKPASAVLHVREATTADGDAALSHAEVRLGQRPGVYLITGHRVLEASVRPTSKAVAVRRLRAETGAATVVFVGDDASDETVLATLGPDDIGVRVGPDPSAARFRLPGPDAVVAMLAALGTLLEQTA